MKHTVVFYRQYGQWSCTMPFMSKAAAELHTNRYLRSNEIRGEDGTILAKNTREHVKDITFVEVELPE